MENARNQIKSLLTDLGVFEKQPCTDEENKEFTLLEKQKQQLPEGIYSYENSYGFYRLVKTDLTDDEIDLLIRLKQTQIFNTIKNCMIFFVVITIISILFALLVNR